VRDLLCTLLNLLWIVLFVQAILSWVPTQPGGFASQLKHTLRVVTEPLLGPIRRLIGPMRIGAGAIDISPIVAFIGIIVLQRAIGC
jgi:YggT family protein